MRLCQGERAHVSICGWLFVGKRYPPRESPVNLLIPSYAKSHVRGQGQANRSMASSTFASGNLLRWV